MRLLIFFPNYLLDLNTPKISISASGGVILFINRQSDSWLIGQSSKTFPNMFTSGAYYLHYHFQDAQGASVLEGCTIKLDHYEGKLFIYIIIHILYPELTPWVPSRGNSPTPGKMDKMGTISVMIYWNT